MRMPAYALLLIAFWPFALSQANPGMLSCLSEGCSDQLTACLSSISCGKALGFDGSPVEGQLIAPLDFSALSAPDAGLCTCPAWAELRRCHAFACDNSDPEKRKCSPATDGMAMHLPGNGACAVAPCHLTNDQPRTATAAECGKRCEAHMLPQFNESCVSWSWGSRPGSCYFEKCYLMQRKGTGMPDRRFVSGACKGGPNKTAEMLEAEAHLCEHIMESPNNLRVYLQVKQQISLDVDKFNDLFTYMQIMHMCPDEGDRFTQVVKHFSPPPPKQDSLFEQITIFIGRLYDFFIKNYAVLSVVATILSPVLLPIICELIARIFAMVPMLECMLVPVLPKVVANYLKRHIERVHGRVSGAESEAAVDEVLGSMAEGPSGAACEGGLVEGPPSAEHAGLRQRKPAALAK